MRDSELEDLSQQVCIGNLRVFMIPVLPPVMSPVMSLAVMSPAVMTLALMPLVMSPVVMPQMSLDVQQ